MNESVWNRVAAATGLGFVGVALATLIIGEIDDYRTVADYVAFASDTVFSTVVLLALLGTALFVWFLGGLVARLRELEGGHGRLATTAGGAGVLFIGLLAAAATATLAARNVSDPAATAALAGFAQEIYFGPVPTFAFAVLILAAGTVGVVTKGLPTYSAVVARLSILTADALLVLGGLWLYRDYAWLNETTVVIELVWVAAMAIIGVSRWGEPHQEKASLDDTVFMELDEDDFDEEEEAPKPKPKPKPRKRTAARKKPATRRKPSARKR